MAHLRNIARDVASGDPFLTGSADIYGPDGTLLASPAVNPTSGIWEFQQNGSPGLTTQEYDGAGQVKRVDGSVGGQAGDWFELELPRLLRLFSDGAIDGLACSAPGGMNVSVGVGNLLNKGAMHCVYTVETKSISAANPTNPRIDIVYSEKTLVGTFTGRLRTLVKTGTPAASPSPPALVDDASVSEIEICRVTVPAAASSIVGGNIDITQRPIASGPLSDGSVTEDKIADGAVTTAKIADLAVTLAKLASEVEAAFRRSPGLINTYWLTLGGVPSQIDNFTISQNTLYATPIHIPKVTTLTGLALRLAVVPGSSITMRLGLYKAAANGLPGTLHHDAGTITTSGAGIQSKTGLSVALPAGWYWAAICFGSFSGSYQLYGRTDPEEFGLLGQTIVGAATSLWSAQGVFSGTGALPATFPAPGLSSSGPLAWAQTSGT